jgi:hypothetical protein
VWSPGISSSLWNYLNRKGLWLLLPWRGQHTSVHALWHYLVPHYKHSFNVCMHQLKINNLKRKGLQNLCMGLSSDSQFLPSIPDGSLSIPKSPCTPQKNRSAPKSVRAEGYTALPNSVPMCSKRQLHSRRKARPWWQLGRLISRPFLYTFSYVFSSERLTCSNFAKEISSTLPSTSAQNRIALEGQRKNK